MGGREEAGKIFVGGLSWNTDQDSLQSYFGQFGEITDCIVMKNPATGKSRGFGFVSFKDPSTVDVILSSKSHTLDGRPVDAKACNARGATPKPSGGRGGFGGGGGGGGMSGRTTKIFIGGLPNNISEDVIREAFGRFGNVTEVVIMFDHEKNRSRGFGFLTFDNEDSVEQACGEHYVDVNGKQVECKKAEPRGAGGGGRGGGSGGRGGRGGGQGGYGGGQSWGGNQGGGWNQGGGGGGWNQDYSQQQQWGGQQQQWGAQQQQQQQYGNGWQGDAGQAAQSGYGNYGYQQGGYGTQQQAQADPSQQGQYNYGAAGYGAQQQQAYGAQQGGYGDQQQQYGAQQGGYGQQAGYGGAQGGQNGQGQQGMGGGYQQRSAPGNTGGGGRGGSSQNFHPYSR